MRKPTHAGCRTWAFLFLIIVSVPLHPSPRKETGDPVGLKRAPDSFTVTGRPERIGDHIVFNGEGLSLELDLRNLSCLAIDKGSGTETVISRAAFPSSPYGIDDGLSEARYPGLGIGVSIEFGKNAVSLGFSSDKPQTVTWPSLGLEREGSFLIWPRFEGSSIPLEDDAWVGHLTSRTWDAAKDLSMPFWGIRKGRRCITYIAESPFPSEMAFSRQEGAGLRLDFKNTFPKDTDRSRKFTVRVYLDGDSSPITPAVHYRECLKDRMRTEPGIPRGIGAVNVLLTGGEAITLADVKEDAWVPMVKEIADQARSREPSAGRQIIGILGAATEYFDVQYRQSTSTMYLKEGIVRSLARVLGDPRLYNESVWPLSTLPKRHRDTALKIKRGESAPVNELLGLNSWLLHASFSAYLNDPSTWGGGFSRSMVDAFAREGLRRLVLGVPDGKKIEMRPELVSYAASKGYLVERWPHGAPEVMFPDLSGTGDQDMDLNEMSRYFLGQSAAAGKPSDALTQAILKDGYVRLYGDPRFRLPLYEAAFHDSAVSTSHSRSATLRFANVAETNMLVEILYQAAPLYWCNGEDFPKILPALKAQADAFQKTHSYSCQFPLEEFEYLTEDLSVQRTRFGKLELTANFGEKDFSLTGVVVPARCVRAVFKDSGKSFVYGPAAAYEWKTAALVSLLSSAEWKERMQAAADLGELGYAGRAAVPALRRALADEEWWVRKAAANALAAMGDAAAPAAPELIKALTDEEWQVCRSAILAVAAAGEPARGAVPLLIDGLGDGEWQIREAAARALANMGEAAAPAVSALAKNLKDGEWQARRAAAYALMSLGANAKASVPSLINALNDGEWPVRRAAALALGSIGDRSRSAMRALDAVKDDPEPGVREAAVIALSRLAGK